MYWKSVAAFPLLEAVINIDSLLFFKIYYLTQVAGFKKREDLRTRTPSAKAYGVGRLTLPATLKTGTN